MAATFPGFPKQAITFFRQLSRNNKREWFQAHKAQYDEHVQAPALELCALVIDDLRAFAADHAGEPKRSLFRIYRDTRFAKDKTPYKTHLGIYFRHAASADAETPGMYLHLEPRHVFMGAGIWHPGSPALKRIRDALVARPEGWRAAVADCGPAWTLADGEKLKRPPAGYDKEHPLIEDIKRKSFAITSPLTQKQVTSSGFLDEWAERAAAARPFMAFLSSALGVAY